MGKFVMVIGKGKERTEDEVKKLVGEDNVEYIGTAAAVSRTPFGNDSLESILRQTLEQLAQEGLQKGAEYISEVRLIIYGDLYKEKSGFN